MGERFWSFRHEGDRRQYSMLPNNFSFQFALSLQRFSEWDRIRTTEEELEEPTKSRRIRRE